MAYTRHRYLEIAGLLPFVLNDTYRRARGLLRLAAGLAVVRWRERRGA